MNRVIYMDNNATTRVADEVAEAMRPYLTERYGNPSSMHTFGGQVAGDIACAREQVAALLGCHPEEILFTSCGTESDSTAPSCSGPMSARIARSSCSMRAPAGSVGAEEAAPAMLVTRQYWAPDTFAVLPSRCTLAITASADMNAGNSAGLVITSLPVTAAEGPLTSATSHILTYGPSTVASTRRTISSGGGIASAAARRQSNATGVTIRSAFTVRYLLRLLATWSMSSADWMTFEFIS